MPAPRCPNCKKHDLEWEDGHALCSGCDWTGPMPKTPLIPPREEALDEKDLPRRSVTKCAFDGCKWGATEGKYCRRHPGGRSVSEQRAKPAAKVGKATPVTKESKATSESKPFCHGPGRTNGHCASKPLYESDYCRKHEKLGKQPKAAKRGPRQKTEKPAPVDKHNGKMLMTVEGILSGLAVEAAGFRSKADQLDAVAHDLRAVYELPV